jgi:hypothetical protein
MKKISISLDEDVARWARIHAAESDTSVSQLVGELLREKMSNSQSYNNAMERYLSQKPENVKRPGSKYPHHQELHER